MRLFFIIFLSTFVFAKTLYIAASSNISYAMKDLINEYKKQYKNTYIKIIYASSGKLTAQILHNAPYDIFLSANMKYPEVLYKNKKALTKPKVFARGLISLFSVKYDNLSIKSLLTAKQIAIANPKFAPYGKAAIEMMKNAKIYNKIKDKLIYSETVTGVIPYVINSADIGIIAKSSLYSKKIKNLGKYYYKDVNISLYSPINQGVVLLTNKKEARNFYNFLFTKKAKNIFKRYGYLE
ncbi:molybdate ABC transporter substrate-binding protein [Caminibacter mediatlanticus TB-2]|uniref:Molybdate ABC transporter substrate-binding protein n=1 Tax=Caminibacter mediatlanticus TB-2 TaxID=391592 RepID=A0AAI9F2N8_9BACT|nr:molybdate ABC transporter substrate-binding protein [Caminibacter mediatlanticus]EDM24003.1 molybdenum ABC transporter ModA [Caminibacter mediatlanticus TB-2]QCT94365.1 molybdate ABC transporter substrate-binding protein [Caminibacter mediatlanticus TB-2]